MYSLFQRVRSLRHRLSYGLSERLGWSRGTFHETAAADLPMLAPEQGERIAALQCRYQVRFETRLNAGTSIDNYEYLDILDRGWFAGGLPRPAGGVLCDIGCANFWYAPAPQAFFRPQRLQGVEIEGYRRYRNGRTRIDYARGYLARIRRNLGREGVFVMVNHAATEAALAAAACDATGLRCIGRDERPGPLSARRLAPAIFSCWTPTRGRS
jgi:hypothetical protein